ncbi:MAG: MFS transporter [Pseudolabrys sp.]|nr:MFS transporter [Pseudolabrys sp.]MCW5686500.1 MFS transporter [Pseudolabrys sp.]
MPMSAVETVTKPIVDDDRLARRNALVLAVAQALAGGNNTVIVATTAIVGAMYAPDKGLATLPITMMVIGMWVGTLPVGYMARRFGRRFALQVGTIFGVLAGLISCVAVLQGSFALILAGTFSGGLYAAAHQSYRFAAADTASEAFRPKAVSWVLAGGLFAGLIGPQIVIFTKDMWPPYLFATTYLAQAGVALLAGVVLVFIRIPKPVIQAQQEAGRPLTEIVRSLRFATAVTCGVVSYAGMNMMMTAAPLAMVDCGHTVTDASLAIQWHVIAMYGPSFFTGSLILRFGVTRVISVGLALLLVAAVVGLSGLTVAHFWGSLILLGVGWNFAFIGATTMVTECHRPSERNRVQAFNDFLVFGSMAIGSLASGKILATLGWAFVNEVFFPLIVIAATMLLWLSLWRRRVA